MSDKRIELQEKFIKEAEEKLLKCQAYCKKHGCQESKQLCDSQTRVVASLKEQLEEMQKQRDLRASSAPHQAALGARFKLLENLSCSDEHWVAIDELIKDPKFDDDDERSIALELLLKKLRREALM